MPAGFYPPCSPPGSVPGRSVDPLCDPSQDGEGPGSALPTGSYPGKGRFLGQGKKGTHSPLLAYSWSFSRRYFSFSIQGDGTTLVLLMDVVGVAPRGLQDMVASRRALQCLQPTESNPVLVGILGCLSIFKKGGGNVRLLLLEVL